MTKNTPSPQSDQTASPIPREKTVPLNVRVPPLFAKQFKSWCALNGITMGHALQNFFEMYKTDNKK